MPHFVMAIDAAKCLNCKACVVACQQRNGVPYGLSRNWIRDFPDSAAPLGRRFQPGACMHCDRPLCVDACPTHATYKADDGSVRIDAARCIGCGGCIEACPYGARFKNPVTGTADKCDYCAATPGQTPACVQVCPTGCRLFGDADNADDPVAWALAERERSYVAPKDFDTKPTLAYLGDAGPLDWPQSRPVPPALAGMGPLAGLVKLFAGLSLFGVVGVFLKQLVCPSGAPSKDAGNGTRDAATPQAEDAPDAAAQAYGVAGKPHAPDGERHSAPQAPAASATGTDKGTGTADAKPREEQ